MREAVAQYLSRAITRRGFAKKLAGAGVSAVAAQSILQSLTPLVHGQDPEPISPDAVRIFQGNGGEAFAEQLIASGVKYIFGNSGSSEVTFYEALVDRPQLQYILTPHEGPGAAMAAGYVKASGEPVLSMQVAVVGLVNAMGQMYNCFKSQVPMVFFTYRADKSFTAGRDGFEEVAYQEEIVGPMTKWHWLARRPDMIPETIRRAYKVAFTPPYGPTYATWHGDYFQEKVRAEVIIHDKVDPRMRVRPNPQEVERAAQLLVEAEQPLLNVGDELYKTNSVDKAIKLAELLGMPVAQTPQIYANFPESHPLWVGRFRSPARMEYPKNVDLVINVGNKMQHGGTAAPMVPHDIKFIDMRIDAASMGNVITTDVPLVADVGYGLDDLIAAVEDRVTPTLKKKAQERMEKTRVYMERAYKLWHGVTRNPYWDQSPLLKDRLTYELTKFADDDAIIVDETESAGPKHLFNFNPLGGREYIRSHAGHLGSGVGTAAGVKLARPNQQVICLTGDGGFIFGPTALWNMARLELPVITVVYNNHSYNGPHNRAVSRHPEGRMVQTGHFPHDYLGKPDMNMAQIANGFGVEGEVVESPDQLKEALARARRFTQEGKPYLIDAQIQRPNTVWAEDPWIPPISGAKMRTRKV